MSFRFFHWYRHCWTVGCTLFCSAIGRLSLGDGWRIPTWDPCSTRGKKWGSCPGESLPTALRNRVQLTTVQQGLRQWKLALLPSYSNFHWFGCTLSFYKNHFIWIPDLSVQCACWFHNPTSNPQNQHCPVPMLLSLGDARLLRSMNRGEQLIFYPREVGGEGKTVREREAYPLSPHCIISSSWETVRKYRGDKNVCWKMNVNILSGILKWNHFNLHSMPDAEIISYLDISEVNPHGFPLICGICQSSYFRLHRK